MCIYGLPNDPVSLKIMSKEHQQQLICVEKAGPEWSSRPLLASQEWGVSLLPFAYLRFRKWTLEEEQPLGAGPCTVAACSGGQIPRGPAHTPLCQVPSQALELKGAAGEATQREGENSSSIT